MTVWVAILASGIVTYITRVLPLAITTSRTAPPQLRRYLDALPIAIIAALAGAGIAVPDAQPTGGAEVGPRWSPSPSRPGAGTCFSP